MSVKRFGNQTVEQIAAHLASSLGPGPYNIEIDTLSETAAVKRSSGGGGESRKMDRLKGQASGMSPKRRKHAMSAKRREKPKLKHVRNGRTITLKGYYGFFGPKSE